MLAAQGPRRNKTPEAEAVSHGVREVVLAKARSRDKVYLRAYSFKCAQHPRRFGRSVLTGGVVLLDCRRLPVQQNKAPVAVA